MEMTSCLLHFRIVLIKIGFFLLNKKRKKFSSQKKLTFVRTLTFYDIKGAELPKILSHKLCTSSIFLYISSNNQKNDKEMHLFDTSA